MDMEKLMQKHPNVSRGELEKMRKTSTYQTCGAHQFVQDVEELDWERRKEKKKGRESVEAGPLVHVLSVHIIPSDKIINQDKPIATYGKIYAEYRDTTSGKTIVHELFSRNCDDAQVHGPSGGPLTLIGPDYSCRLPYEDCTLLNNTWIVVDAFMGDGNNLFAEKQLCSGDEDMTIDLEKVKLEYVHGEICSLALRYIVMPFAVYGHVEAFFIYKRSDGEKLVKRSINVKGRIVARYGNNSRGSECTLFEKQYDNEFERVEEDPIRGSGSMRLSRCWVGVPAYSSLILDLDLSEFGSGRKILKETVELRVVYGTSGDEFIVDDDILIFIQVGWVSPSPQGRQELMELDGDDGDDDGDDGDDGDDDGDDDDEASCVPVVSSSNLSCPWILHPIVPYAIPSMVEIFSVFIGREKYKPLQVYGSIQVVSGQFTFYVFKREAKKDAFRLSEHSKTLPLLDGSRVYDDFDSLKMKIDLKDVESHWYIKGYVNWDYGLIDSGLGSQWLNKQLCSVIQGQHGGYAVIHYSIFSESSEGADYAIVGLLCIPRNEAHVDECFHPKVHGSIVAQYNNYDYTSRYNKDYYRIVLFQRNRDDAAQPGIDGFIPLSRSVVAMPSNSSLVIEASLGNSFSDGLSFEEFEFDVGDMKEGAVERNLIMEGNDYYIYICVKRGG